MDFERIKVNIADAPVDVAGPLSVVDMIETDDELLIKLEGKECYDIFPGQELYFHRWIGRGSSIAFCEMEKSVTVLSEDENHIIHTTKPDPYRFHIIKPYYGFENDEISGVNYTVLRCDDNHNIFAQDLDTNTGQEVYAYDYDGNLLRSFSGILIPYMTDYLKYVSGGTLNETSAGTKYITGGKYYTMGGNKVFTKEDAVELAYEEDMCGYEYDKFKTYKYEFLPDMVSRNTILVANPSEDDPYLDSIFDDISYIETKFNPFYFTRIEVDEDGNEIKRCYFYEDNWWYEIEHGQHQINEQYINCGVTSSFLTKGEAFWGINVKFSNDEQTTLGSEDMLGEYLDRKIQETMIPKVIDMERLKYVPAIVSGDVVTIATSITMDFHFRKREMVNAATVSGNTQLTQDNVYVDGWSVAEDDWKRAWWNGMDYSGDTFNKNKFAQFYNSNGKKSDLLGYLNFIDTDVFYQKKKLSESFLRLSFYTSPYVTDQKLLFYSTIYLDGTNLFGEYVRQLPKIESGALKSSYSGVNSGNVASVFCEGDASTRLDSELVVTNEFDRTRSAEGFNLYLFADDAKIKDLDEYGQEKDERTIYMKAEFNHAGNGKTIPMIQNWPKKGNNYAPLTTSNFIESLYIPVKVKYINNKYIYYIPGAVADGSGNIRLIFFEPKLDEEEIDLSGISI